MTPDEQYFWNERNRRDYIAMLESAIPKNLIEKKFELAASNCGGLAETFVDLGLLHWRRGIDPRPAFERGVAAYDQMREMARNFALPSNKMVEIPYVYAMLFLMGCKTPIEFEEPDYHKEHRWPCYQCCVVHALHDQPLDSYHENLLNTYLGTNDELADRIVRTYLQLLEGLPSDELVKMANDDWTRRKTDRFFSGGGPAYDGHGVMNEIYVDLLLSAVLKKIGWEGQSLHLWKW